MTKAEARQLLRDTNEDASEDLVRLYVDTWAIYTDAQANLDENGAVCQHPRTGQPFENPYLKVRDRAMASLLTIRIDADALWTDSPTDPPG